MPTLNWTKDRPTAEGWYLWRKNKTSHPSFLHAYYVELFRSILMLIEAGNEISWPSGGWWARIETGDTTAGG